VLQKVDNLGQLLNMHPLCLAKVSIAFIMIFHQTPVGPHSLDYLIYWFLMFKFSSAKKCSSTSTIPL
jgi:hypothetical protein